MSDAVFGPCIECQGKMSPVVVMDKVVAQHQHAQELEYRQPDDSRSFWTGKFPTAGRVSAYPCVECGRIAMYGIAPKA